MRSLSVIFTLFFSFILMSNNEIYFGFILLLFTFIIAIKYAAASVYGDFSRTAAEIRSYVKLQEKKPSFDYLSYPEQKAVIEERRKQDIIDRRRECAESKAQAKRIKRVYRRTDNSSTSFSVGSDDLTSTNSVNHLFDNDADYFIHNTISDESAYDAPLINPSTGLPMLSNGCGGMGGVDVEGHCWGESESVIGAFSDSFTSIDNSLNSFDDSNDCFSAGMDDW